MMERYAEFIGTHSADHVITEALEFVFKKDTDFREWLDKNPKRNPEPSMRKTNATRSTETARVSDTAERQEALWFNASWRQSAHASRWFLLAHS
jgi:hypothetical protein